MKNCEDDLVIVDPPYRSVGAVRGRRFGIPGLRLWSINRTEDEEPDVTGEARHDYERELRIKALGNLVCAAGATPLWRRVCMAEMTREIRSRSAGQRLAMELAIAESMRG